MVINFNNGIFNVRIYLNSVIINPKIKYFWLQKKVYFTLNHYNLNMNYSNYIEKSYSNKMKIQIIGKST